MDVPAPNVIFSFSYSGEHSFKMVDKLGPEEFISLWDLTIDKMVRFHDNISMEIAEMIKTIQKTMNTDGNALVPACEARAAFGKVNTKI